MISDERVIQANPPLQLSSGVKGNIDPIVSASALQHSSSSFPVESVSALSIVNDSATSVKANKIKSVRIDDNKILIGDLIGEQISFDESSKTEQSISSQNLIILPGTATSSLSKFHDGSLEVTSTNVSGWQMHSDDIASPIDDSSEDHAEIDQTSTEASIENNRLDHDVLDTRTEDEAPDIDDDVLPLSGPQGQVISDRHLSVEATEDTDITTPIEMRDSQTEIDVYTSLLSGECKDPSLSKEGEHSRNDTNEKEISEYQEEVPDYLNVEEGGTEAVKSGESSVSETNDNDDLFVEANELVKKTLTAVAGPDQSDSSMTSGLLARSVFCTEYVNVWPSEEHQKARRTESTVVETGSTEEGSPSDSKSREPSFSDLIDSDEMNRDSLEDDFDKLVAETNPSPSCLHSTADTKAAVPFTSSNDPQSSLTPIPSSLHQPTILEAGTNLACQYKSVNSCTIFIIKYFFLFN